MYTNLCLLVIACAITIAKGPQQPESVDVVIYGGTSAGIAAAIQTKRMGKTVLLIEPSSHLGGLTTGGLGQTDIGNKAAIGGISREFYRRVRAHYQQPENWNWQAADQYRSGGQSRTAAEEDTMWTFEPHVALKIYREWLDELQIPVVFNERLNRQTGVATTRSIPWKIVAITMQSGQVYRGKMFIDASISGISKVPQFVTIAAPSMRRKGGID